MNSKTEQILEELLQLAKGDPLLVQRALAETANEKGEVNLKAVRSFLEGKHVKEAA